MTPPLRDIAQQIHNAHYHRVYLYCLGSAAGRTWLAEDWTSQAFVNAYRTYGVALADKSASAVQGLLITSARNLIIDTRKKSRREEIVDFTDSGSRVSVSTFARGDCSEDVASRDVVERFWKAAGAVLSANQYRVAFMTWRMQIQMEFLVEIMASTRERLENMQVQARRKFRAAELDRLLTATESSSHETTIRGETR